MPCKTPISNGRSRLGSRGAAQKEIILMFLVASRIRAGMGMLVITAAFAGCSAKGPALTPVAGTVTLDDKPLEGAQVFFYLQGKSVPGYMGSSVTKTDAAGKYELKTGGRPGVVPGDYKVTIGLVVTKDGAPLKLEEGMDLTQLEMQGLAKQSLPEKYCNLEKSELSVKVEEGKSENYNFPLKSS